MHQPDFKIEDKGPASKKFLEHDISGFQQALVFIKQLPYGRNANKEDLLSLFADNCGTCSTKHALLKKLADENNFRGLELILGLIKMSRENTPSLKKTLELYGLSYIPEAHNYLRYEGEIIDCTKQNWNVSEFSGDILEETEISPGQITDYKMRYHKAFLNKWLSENKDIPYNLEQLWSIREQCIRDLSS